MANFVKTAAKQVTDVRVFLRESAGGNGIKYVAEKGSRHLIYIPYTTQMVIDEETGAEGAVKTLCAISGDVHEWSTADNKFKATICIKDIIRKADDGTTILNDGKCPFCDRVSDGWDIYNYRKELEENTCKLTGESRKKHLENAFGTFRDERKAKEVRKYMYILIVKFKTNDSGAEVLGDDKLPEYELKVMKLSASRVEKIQQQIMNSGSELPGSELIFEYPNVDDRRLLVSQSTTTPVFPSNMITAKYPAIINKINEDVSKFDWDGIDKSFAEWGGMTTSEAESTVEAMFEQWDAYKKERLVNPNAKYLEYVVQAPTAVPSLGGDVAGVLPSAAPAIPNVPTVPGMAVPGAVPGVAVPGVVVPNIQMPGAPVTDPNAVFAGGATAPSIQI